MKAITAFKCERTGALFLDEAGAARSEFKALMRQVGGSCPAMGSIAAYDILAWLAGNIESGVYPTVLPKLKAALDYFEEHKAVIRPSTYGNSKADAPKGDDEVAA